MPIDTGEWLSPRMRVLPPDVRGLWVDLLCCMWESSERGVMVKSNQVAHTKQEIIRMIGVDATGSDSWLDLLVENGFCAVRESDGAYYSRHIVREEKIRAKRREAGKKGGDVTKAKLFSLPVQKEAQSAPIPPAKVEKPPEQNLFPPDEVSPDSPPPLTPEQKAKAEKAKKYKYADFVTLTRDEYSKLVEQYSEEDVKGMISVLDNYKGQNGKRYKSDYRAILNWVVNAYFERKAKGTYDTQRTGIFPGAGNENNQSIPTGATGSAQSGTVPGGSEKPQKNYSERFV